MAKVAAAEKTSAPVVVVEKAAPTECAKGHPRAENWVVTASGGRCRVCANEASRASKAKHAKPNPKRLTPEVLGFLEDMFQASKRGSAEQREQVAAWLEANR